MSEGRNRRMCPWCCHYREWRWKHHQERLEKTVQIVYYWSENRSVSDSLRPHGLYSPWNSPFQNTGVDSFSLLQGSSQPRDRTQVSHIAGGFFTRWATREAQQRSKHRLSSLARHGGGCRHQLDSAPPLGSFLGSWGGVLHDKQAAWFENMCVFTSPAVEQIDIICFLIRCSEKDTSSLLWCAGQNCVTWV